DDVSVELMPMPNDRPSIDAEFYDAKDRRVLIQFKTAAVPKREQVDSHLIFLFEPKTNAFSGLELREVDESTFAGLQPTIKSRLYEYLHSLLKPISEERTFEKRLALLGKWDTERRKVEFMLDEIPSILQNRAEAPQ